MNQRLKSRQALDEVRINQLTHYRAKAFAVLLVVMGVAIVWQWSYPKAEYSVQSLDRPFVVDLNSASESELNLLPGVGPKLARDILEYREQHGAFVSVDELKNVRGIKDGRLKSLAPYLAIVVHTPSPALPLDVLQSDNR